MIELDDVLRCRQKAPEDKSVTGLLDFNCIMEGTDEQACVEGVDGAGNLCVWQDSELFGGLCLSVTQTNVMEFMMETIDSLGLDIDSLMNGDMMLGGDVEIDAVPQLYGDYPGSNEEAVSVSSSNNADESSFESSSGEGFDDSQDSQEDYPEQGEYDDAAESVYPEEDERDYPEGEGDDEEDLPISSSNANESAPSEKNEDEEDAEEEDEVTKAEEPVPPTTHHQEPAVLPKATKPSLVQSILTTAARDGSVQEQTKHNGGGLRG